MPHGWPTLQIRSSFDHAARAFGARFKRRVRASILMPMTRRQGAAWSCLALVVAVFAAYGGFASHEFIAYDTTQYLTRNEWVSRGLGWPGVAWAFTTFHAANWHPLTWLSHMLDVQLFGLRAGPLHFENVAWHAANACLVFLVLSEMTRAPRRSLCVALLFALHPLHVESVAWIVERKDLLCAFFGLACLWFWTRWTRAPRWTSYTAALACSSAGLMCKPMLVTLPCVLLLLDVWPLDRTALGARRLLFEKLPFFLLSLASSAITLLAQSAGGAVRSFAIVPLSPRASNAAVAYATYLARTVWPSHLSFFYPLQNGDLSVERVSISVCVLLGATVLAWFLRRRAPWFLVGWLFYLGTLVPVIGLVQVGAQAMADRYTYLPLLGVFVAFVWTAREWLRAESRATSYVIAGTICVLLGCATWRQFGLWKDTKTLCTHALAVDPRNHVAHVLLGLVHLDGGELDEAENELRAALRIEPDDPDALIDLGNVLFRKGRFAEAESVYRRALFAAPASAELHCNLAFTLWAERRAGDALPELETALHLAPRLARAHLVSAQILEELRRFDEARASLARALEVDPEYAEAHAELGRLLRKRGDLDGARVEIERAISESPMDAGIHRERVLLLLSERRTSDALSAARETLELRPGWGLAQSDVAWILATADDPALRAPQPAVEIAERAARSGDANDPYVLDALAAAYAANGRFDLAIRAAERASSAADAIGDHALESRIASRLRAYREQRIDRVTPR